MQNFNNHVAGLAIELLNNAEAHFEGKAEFKELRLAVCQNVCHFSVYRVSNMCNYSTMQLYTAVAKAIMAAIKERASEGYYAHKAIFEQCRALPSLKEVKKIPKAYRFV